MVNSNQTSVMRDLSLVEYHQIKKRIELGLNSFSILPYSTMSIPSFSDINSVCKRTHNTSGFEDSLVC